MAGGRACGDGEQWRRGRLRRRFGLRACAQWLLRRRLGGRRGCMRFRGSYQLPDVSQGATDVFVKGELTASVDWKIEVLDVAELAKDFV